SRVSASSSSRPRRATRILALIFCPAPPPRRRPQLFASLTEGCGRPATCARAHPATPLLQASRRLYDWIEVADGVDAFTALRLHRIPQRLSGRRLRPDGRGCSKRKAEYSSLATPTERPLVQGFGRRL